MIENLRLSLSDLLGADYTRAVCEARALLTGENPEALRALADEKIDWYPEAFARRQEELMEHVWDNSVDSFSNSIRVHISALRKKLRAVLGYDPIRNRIGEGYLMGGEEV